MKKLLPPVFLIALFYYFSARYQVPQHQPDLFASDATAIVDYVYDGDTFFAYITTIPSLADRRVSIRVRGYNAAEKKNPKCAAEKKLALQHRQTLISKLPNTVTLKDLEWDAYGRIAANVLTHDTQDIGKAVIAQINDHRLFSNDPTRWCP